MVANELLMQFQADISDCPWCARRRRDHGTGAAYAAGLAVGFWGRWKTFARTGAGQRMAAADEKNTVNR